MPYRDALCRRLSGPVADCLRRLSCEQAAELTEIRVRLNMPIELVIGQTPYMADAVQDEKGLMDLVSALSGYALYRCEAQLSQGYLPLPDGHRAGICGKMVIRDGMPSMTQITSVCIRIARVVKGAAKLLYPHLLTEDRRARSVLILGPPGTGKTTVLKDCAMYLSEKGIHVAAADEREEMGDILGEENGVDVLSGLDKAQAMMLLIRSMAPQVVITDEIGREEDAEAILDAVHCGIGALVSAHADDLRDASKRPVLRQLIESKAFERYVILNRDRGRLTVLDRNGCRIPEEKENDVKRSGCYGDDICERSGSVAF